MRYYSIMVGGGAPGASFVGFAGIAGIGGGATYTSHSLGQSNPGALNVEMDIPVVPFATPMGAAMVRIWGISVQEIGQASNLNGKDIQVYGGMQAGLPLANPAQAGLLVQGFVFQAFGNWINTEMTLDLIINPGPSPNGIGTAAAPRNIVLNWKANQPLSTALKNALSSAFPGYQQSINISANIVRPSDEVAYFNSVLELAQWVKETSKSIVKTDGYAGVDLVLFEKTFAAYDGTVAPTNAVKQIQFQDLIGQPTWIDAPLIQWKCPMRADIKVGDRITLPPSQITNTQQAATSLVNQSVNFQGGFTVSLVRHVGNFRQPDAASWATVFEGYPSTVA